MARSISSNLIEKWARENLFLEIPLWKEKVFDESRRVITKLRCTEYLKEIEHLPTFKRNWIDGYDAFKLYDVKKHVSGKPHEKALRSYKASVLGLPCERKQKEIDASISKEEFSRLQRKANIAYFAAKNDIAFNKFPDLVDVVAKEGNLDKEKDMGSLYVNKQGCTEFVNAHSDVNFDDMARALKETNFFSILMDGSTIHNKEKEAVYIQYFQKENFIKGGDPTKTVLLHLTEPEGISVNATELKNCLIKSLKIFRTVLQF